MFRIENHCCNCATPGYPCLAPNCPETRIKVYYCDKCDPKCDYPLEDVYEADGYDLCEDCLKEMFRKED